MSVTKLPSKDDGPKQQTVIDELADLPETVLKELSVSFKKGNETQTEIDTFQRLTELFANSQAPLTLDEILVAHYRTWGLVLKRNALSAQLQKLTQKGKLIRPTSRTYFLADT